MRNLITTTVMLLVVSCFADAQNLGSDLAKVAKPYGQAYVTPLVNAFGTDMNSGLFHTADVGGTLPFGLKLYVGVQVGGTLVSSSDKSFNLGFHDTSYVPIGGVTTKVFSFDTVINAPTVFGSKDKGTLRRTYMVNGLSHTDSIQTIAGFNVPIVPVPIPQASLGSLFGTDLTVRYLPQIKLSDFGKVQLFGWALRHSVSQYIPLIPVDIAIQLGFQNLSLKDTAGSNIFKLSTFAANVEVSKTLAILTVYGGLQMESSKVDVNYIFIPPGQTAQHIPVSFSVTGKNKFRALLGLDLGLGPLAINADYSVGAISAVTVGLGFSI